MLVVAAGIAAVIPGILVFNSRDDVKMSIEKQRLTNIHITDDFQVFLLAGMHLGEKSRAK